MIRWHTWFAVLSIGLLMVCAERAAADTGTSSKPLSNTGGYSGSELRSIYRRDIGTGYSVASITRDNLRSVSANVPYVGQSTRGSSGSLGILSSPRLSKPFANISSAPTVSPYLNLFRESLDGNDDLNYNTLVRPQLEQQRMNDQLQRQNMEIARRVQAIAAQADYNPEGSKSQYPTGHSTVFMYYGHYYPSASRR